MNEKEPTFVQSRFDRAAATWDENPRRLLMARAVSEKMIERLAPTPSMEALEIGCGTGLVTVQLASFLRSVRALDSSDNMLAQLRAKSQSLGLDNIRPLLADLEHEPVPGGPYDLVFSNMTFHHMNGIDAVLEKIHAVLAPGGRVAVSDLDREDGSFHEDMTGVAHLGFTRGAMITALETAGFSDCTIETAHIVEKKAATGDVRRYSLFLATGRK
ncbi:class I SAM-dependent methyltransferase [Desulfatiferula olefinivorans]